MDCYPCTEMIGTARPATHQVQAGNKIEHVCDEHANLAREGREHGDLPPDTRIDKV